MIYNYYEAVSRNIGWLTEWEQLALRYKKVAIAGMGGVGGTHLLTLTRLGISRFNIADLDTFEVANFNRQIGANLSTVNQAKAETLADQAKQINPEAEIGIFPNGISESNINEFLQDVDIFVDGFDFFVLDIRAKVFQRCHELGIPAITAAPIGMGTAYLSFLPGQMTFEEYFRLNGLETKQKYVKFAVGLTPKGFHRHYLVDPTRLDLENKRGPSTIMAINLCAGVLVTEVLKILTGRGTVYAAPYYHQFDAFTGQFKRGKLHWGNNHPLQKLKCKIGYRQFRKLSENAITTNSAHYPNTELEEILNLARWAPSGDNTQPWRFRIMDPNTVEIYGEDTRSHCVYDLDGYPTRIALGAFLESAEIAASAFKKTISIISNEPDAPSKFSFTVSLSAEKQTPTNPLISSISLRSTQRRPFSMKPLSHEQKILLQEVAGSEFSLHWLESFSDKLRMARLLFKSAHIRLTIKEAYEVHKSIIEWDKTYSQTKIPDQAIGLDAMNIKLMKWVMTSWKRVQIFNRFFAGTVSPRVQLDFIPALLSGAHFLLISKHPLAGNQDYINGGKAMQRVWLKATQLGLRLQPEMTPLIFTRYIDNQVSFTASTKATKTAERVRLILNDFIGESNRKQAVFLGRIGYGKLPKSRSIRRPLHQLKGNSE